MKSELCAHDLNGASCRPSGCATMLAPIKILLLEHERPIQHPCSPSNRPATYSGGDMDITIYPRTAKAGVGEGPKNPVRISRDLLAYCFGMPLHAAADHLGICITALKKVCRKFGIQKWPYRGAMLQIAKSDGSCGSACEVAPFVRGGENHASALASLAEAACSTGTLLCPPTMSAFNPSVSKSSCTPRLTHASAAAAPLGPFLTYGRPSDASPHSCRRCEESCWTRERRHGFNRCSPHCLSKHSWVGAGIVAEIRVLRHLIERFDSHSVFLRGRWSCTLGCEVSNQ